MKAIDCVSVEPIGHSGATRMTALCYDSTGSFYRHMDFYGYDEGENEETMASFFLNRLVAEGMSVRGYSNDKGSK